MRALPQGSVAGRARLRHGSRPSTAKVHGAGPAQLLVRAEAGLQRRGMEKIARINPEDDKTATLGKSESFFQELFGNVGQVGAAGGPLGGQPTGRDGPR